MKTLIEEKSCRIQLNTIYLHPHLSAGQRADFMRTIKKVKNFVKEMTPLHAEAFMNNIINKKQLAKPTISKYIRHLLVCLVECCGIKVNDI